MGAVTIENVVDFIGKTDWEYTTFNTVYVRHSLLFIFLNYIVVDD